jgi:WD40 repeat protein
MDGTDINAVDRSAAKFFGEYNCLVSGDDRGKVKVWRYPIVKKGSNYVEGRGHSSHVTNVKWSGDSKWVVSVGGEDQSVMVWKVEQTQQ